MKYHNYIIISITPVIEDFADFFNIFIFNMFFTLILVEVSFPTCSIPILFYLIKKLLDLRVYNHGNSYNYNLIINERH